MDRRMSYPIQVERDLENEILCAVESGMTKDDLISTVEKRWEEHESVITPITRVKP